MLEKFDSPFLVKSPCADGNRASEIPGSRHPEHAENANHQLKNERILNYLRLSNDGDDQAGTLR